MNQQQKRTLTEYAKAHKVALLGSLRTGAGRGVEAKEANFNDVKDLLRLQGCNITDADVADAVTILKAQLGRELEVQKPPADNGAARKKLQLDADSSAVKKTIKNIDVRLDNDQLKHQHPTKPIGTRQKAGGNRFKDTCDAEWHKDNTLKHMADWAVGLGAMAEGTQTYHGQAVPVNGIHYEGFCLMAGGQKYVLFHCYPSDDSDLKL
ncbi:hypothetical protein [Polyangium sp. y55x31]|uniref:hypothetical protein n=1 Tax=Polyangium sp. y55x31 TaxID=3042688 RepID=UPI002482EF4E|nr:hypothetical protein [Polyangium sp. y55x31]MDI1481755.1 hypothetical protein [Polyangium sp. y55x31]